MSKASQAIIQQLKELGDKSIAEHSQRFFKTAKGEYGEGDIFLGIRMPVLRKVAKQHKAAPLKDVLEILKSELHEARMLALLIMVLKFKSASLEERKDIYKEYLAHTRYINNWDLVDCSGMYIVGAYLSDKDRQPLYKLVKSESLWERRISIFSSFYFIRQNDFSDTLRLAELLLEDQEDLIHKVVGWMLREIGKRDIEVEREFLNKHYHRMPRTMLRYAIERFEEKERQGYLKGTIS